MAVAFVYPSRKLADVKLSSVVKRLLKEPKFAAGTRREEIKMCVLPEGLDIPVEKFVEICLNSMKAIAAFFSSENWLFWSDESHHYCSGMIHFKMGSEITVDNVHNLAYNKNGMKEFRFNDEKNER